MSSVKFEEWWTWNKKNKKIELSKTEKKFQNKKLKKSTKKSGNEKIELNFPCCNQIMLIEKNNLDVKTLITCSGRCGKPYHTLCMSKIGLPREKINKVIRGKRKFICSNCD